MEGVSGVYINMKHKWIEIDMSVVRVRPSDDGNENDDKEQWEQWMFRLVR